MDWQSLSVIFGYLFGAGGIGSLALVYKRLRETRDATKLNSARISQIKADIELSVEHARASLFNDMQEERENVRKQNKDLIDQVSLLKARVTMLEGILKANNMPIPS